ncbi:phosphorylase [Trinickia sp. EG282A]|uniref:phosphorylase n=1 Tax=Trinickia sp. EG282A TaxID=3237013 RepID=UPI0034D23040
MSSLLTPNTLLSAIVRRTAHALECGALRPIETASIALDDGAVRFLVRQVSSLARKTRERGDHATNSPSPRVDPFLPYDPDLFVADITPTHVALLNKFNVIDHHLLIVTRAFEEQEALLNIDDFTAWLACLTQFEPPGVRPPGSPASSSGALGFYNGGEAAGASQRHKHMQLVPLPLAADAQSPSLPIEPLVSAALAKGADVTALDGLPFMHAFAPLPPAPAPVAALDLYLRLMEALGLIDKSGPGAPARQASPYNLLLTPRWMLVVPRRAECADGVSINALGFAGSLFVRDAGQMETVRRLRPMTLLERVSMPRDANA